MLRHLRVFPGLALAGGAALVMVTTIGAAAGQSARRTVWDGVYSNAQAERATATFESVCSRCHTLAPGGNTQGGAISGDKFWTAFTQKSVGDLLGYVSKNMPNGNGGSLAASTYNDLVALILRANGFPAGDVDVSPESVAGIQIIPKDGATELPANVLARVVGCLTKSGSDWVLTRATLLEECACIREERVVRARLATGDLLDGVPEPRLHRPLERQPARPDRLDLSRVEQRPLDLRIEVLEEADDVVLAGEGSDAVWSAADMVAMESRHRVRELLGMLPRQICVDRHRYSVLRSS
jgi:hypothetical protein